MPKKSDTFVLTPLWRGAVPYSESLAFQERVRGKASGHTVGFLIGFECRKPCITLGLRGRGDRDLIHPPEECQKQGMEVVFVKRGGQATLHSPGQLVIYPVLDLLKWKIKLRDFLDRLQQITIQTLGELGVDVFQGEKFAGLFTSRGKVAFFGVHICGGVSQHGLAINVCNDLKLFNKIKSCGEKNRPHDSLKNTGLTLSCRDLFLKWSHNARHHLTPL